MVNTAGELIVVVPVYVLTPLKTTAPELYTVNPAVPLSTPAMIVCFDADDPAPRVSKLPPRLQSPLNVGPAALPTMLFVVALNTETSFETVTAAEPSSTSAPPLP